MKSEVFNMDCLEAMKNYPDNYFELAIVDPPYGIGIDGQKENKKGKKNEIESNILKRDGIHKHLMKNILKNFLEFRIIRLYGALIIL